MNRIHRRHPRPTLPAALLAFVLLLICARPAAAQEQPADAEAVELAREIERTVTELAEVRQAQRRQSADHADRVEALQRRIDELETDVEQAERTVEDQAQRIAELREARDAQEQTIDAARDAMKRITDHAAPLARQVAADHARSPAGATDDAAAILTDAADALDHDDPTERIEALDAWLTTLGEQWPRARRVSLANQPIDLEHGERRIHGWVMQLGLVHAVFLGEDGRTVGVWSTNAADPWRVNPGEPFEQRIVDLLAIARQQQPPRLAPLPLTVPPHATDGPDGADDQGGGR